MGKKNKQNVQNKNKGEGNMGVAKGVSPKSKNISKNLESMQPKKQFANGEQNKKKFMIQPKQQNGAEKETSKGAKIKKSKENKDKAVEAVVEAVESNVVLKLDKRNKTRLKCEMKKEMILKGKDPTVMLGKQNLLENKLKKLVAKPEPRSVKVQKKILLIESLLNKLKDKKGAKKDTEEKKPVEANGDKKSKKKNKSEGEKPETDKTKGKEKDGEKPKGKNFLGDQFVVFVGNLPVTITQESLLEAFKEVKGISKVRLPRKRAGKTRRFAYVQVENEEARLNFIKMHGTIIEGKPVNIFYANRKKGKSMTPQNVQLMQQRKLAQVTESESKEIGKQLQKKNKDKKKQKAKVEVEEEDDNSESD